MNEQKARQWIAQQAGRMSSKDMALHLGIKERKVKKLLEEIKVSTRRAAPHPSTSSVRIAALNPWHHVFAVVLFALAALAVYSNSFRVPFLFDDDRNIAGNLYLRSWSGLLTYFRLNAANFMAMVSYALNYRFGGLGVGGYHAVNLSIHWGCACLVYAFILALWDTLRQNNFSESERPPDPSDRFVIALLAALVFLCHPVQTEAVTYIVQRNTSLAVLFYLAAMSSYAHFRNGHSIFFLVAASGFALGAMFTKQIAFTLPFSLLLYELCFRQNNVSKTRRITLASIGLFAALLLLALCVIYSKAVAAGGLSGAARETEEMSRTTYFLTQWNVLRTYVRLLCLPVAQNLDYDYPLTRGLNVPTLASGFFLFLLLASAVILHKKKIRIAAFCVGWFFVTLSVESSFIPIRDVIFEHRLYLPMLGFAIGAGWWSWKLFHRRRRVWIATATVLILALGIAAYRRNDVWKSVLTLWQDCSRKSPNKARPANNLGLAYSELGDYEKAVAQLEKAVRLEPEFTDAYNNLGNVYVKKKEYTKALPYYLEALKYQPENCQPYENLGRAYYELQQYDKALEYLAQSLKKNPDSGQTHVNLALVYHQTGDLEKEILHAERALELFPDNVLVTRNLGIAFGKKGDWERSVLYLEKAVRLDPDNPNLVYNLGVAYVQNRQSELVGRQIEKLERLGDRQAASKLRSNFKGIPHET
jgi:tetratricopeptide (TPR) repeat protein